MSAVFLLKRLILAVPTLFGVAVIVFVLLRVVPGDPINMMIGPGATPKDIQALREVYGLDKSIWDQFVIYLSDLAHGDFGTSISLRQDVLHLILGRLPVTIELCAAGHVARGRERHLARHRRRLWPGPLAGGAGRRLFRPRAGDPRFPVGAAVHPSARRRHPDHADLRPARLRHRVPAGDRVLSDREPDARPASASSSPCCST